MIRSERWSSSHILSTGSWAWGEGLGPIADIWKYIGTVFDELHLLEYLYNRTIFST